MCDYEFIIIYVARQMRRVIPTFKVGKGYVLLQDNIANEILVSIYVLALFRFTLKLPSMLKSIIELVRVCMYRIPLKLLYGM